MNYLTIVIISVLVFWRSYRLKYVVDDDVWHGIATRKRSANVKLKHLPRHWREILYGAGLFKEPSADHVFSVLIHTINACLIYRASGSMLAACLWLINPINHQTSLWLNGRRYALSLLAVLIGWNFIWTAPLVAIFCAWFHISGAVFPFLFLFTPMWWLSAMSIVAALFGWNDIVARMMRRADDFRPGNENQKISPKKIILYVKSVGWYFQKIIAPEFPSMYTNFLNDFGHTHEANKKAYSLNWEFWRGAAVLVLLLYLILIRDSFWAFWFLLFISPWCNIYQVTMNATDRYQTIAGVGIMVLVAEWIGNMPYELQIITTTMLSAYYLMKYEPLFKAYLSVEKFHRYHIEGDPTLINPRVFLSKIWIARKDPMSSFANIKDGMRVCPNDFKLLLGLWEAFWTMRNIPKALQCLDEAEKRIPIGEEEDAKTFFGEIRKEADIYLSQIKTGKRVIHNNGKPIIKKGK